MANMQSWLLLLVLPWELSSFIIEAKDFNTQPERYLQQHFRIGRGKSTSSNSCFFKESVEG